MSKVRTKRSSANATIPVKMLIKLANDRPSPLKALPDYDAEAGCLHRRLEDEIDALDLSITCSNWTELSGEVQEWMINLTEANMSQLYEESSWGWSRQTKLSELKHKNARLLLVNVGAKQEGEYWFVFLRHLVILFLFCFSESKLPIAFVHFRFEEGYANDPALYCYELQIVEQVVCKFLSMLENY